MARARGHVDRPAAPRGRSGTLSAAASLCALSSRRLRYAEPGLQNLGVEMIFRPRKKNELVLSIKMGCADTVPFQSKLNTPF